MEEKPKETLGKSILKAVLEGVFGAAFGYLAAETYDRCMTPEEKKRWESWVKTHHGEAGVLMMDAGIAAKSPALAGFGLGLMVHDREDAAKWFSGDKQKMHPKA